MEPQVEKEVVSPALGATGLVLGVTAAAAVALVYAKVLPTDSLAVFTPAVAGGPLALAVSILALMRRSAPGMAAVGLGLGLVTSAWVALVTSGTLP